MNNNFSSGNKHIFRNAMPMDRRISTDTCNGDRPASISSRTSGDDLSVEDCERMVLSPPPVPITNFEATCAAIDAAARRSNSSRTHSIKTQLYDGHGDTGSHPSNQDLSKSNMEQIPSYSHSRQVRSGFTWRRLLCCCSTNVGPPVSQKGRLENKTLVVTPIGVENGQSAVSVPESTTKKSNKKKLMFWTSKKAECEFKDEQSHPSSRLPRLPESRTSTSPHPPFTSIPAYTPTDPPYRPSLPDSVINALVAMPKEPYSPSSPSSSTAHTTPSTESPPHASTSFMVSQFPPAPPLPRPSSSIPITFPRMPGVRIPYTQIGHSVRETSRNSSSVAHTQLPNSLASEEQNSKSHPRSSLAVNLWDSGDAVDQTILNDADVNDYRMTTDQNGAQGDSSSENLEIMPPGMDLLGELPADCVNKKCLVIDLDETLVHSWFKYVDNASFVVNVELEGVQHQIYVCKRPHLDEFLRAIGPLFECVMFTASLRKYADPVCDFIDEASHFRHRLFREACVYHQNNLIKDLSRLGRDVDQICILDNSPVSFLFQPTNALQIVSWFDDAKDQALLDLIPYLQGLARSETVVDYLRDFQPPASAAIAQPSTPSWLLYNMGYSHESDENEGSDHADEFGYDYSEEDAVLSPHFLPPPNLPVATTTATTTTTASIRFRNYLSTINSQPTAQQRTTYLPNSNPPVAAGGSFIHQLTKPPDLAPFNSLGTISVPPELTDSPRSST